MKSNSNPVLNRDEDDIQWIGSALWCTQPMSIDAVDRMSSEGISPARVGKCHHVAGTWLGHSTQLHYLNSPAPQATVATYRVVAVLPQNSANDLACFGPAVNLDGALHAIYKFIT